MGYCPFACVGSQYKELYRDIGLGRQAWERDRRHDTAGLERSRTQRHGHGHMACRWGVCRNTNGRIMTGGWPGCWVYRKTCYDTARNSTSIWPSMRYETAQEAHDMVGRAAIQRCDTARQHARACSDTAWHKCDMAGEGATIRPNARHDTAS